MPTPKANSGNITNNHSQKNVPSDFDPTPLDKLLFSSTSDQEEEEVEQFYAFRALLDSLEGIDDITTRDTGQTCTASVVGKEEETSSNTNRPSKLTMSHETEIINRDVTCNNADITTHSGGCNSLNEDETAEKSSMTTEAQHFIRAFQNEKKTQRSFLGHKETIFSVKFSSCQRFVASASQEATIKLWDVKSNRCVATLTGHHREYECLRVAW